MRVKHLAAGIFACAAFVLAGEARAGDVIRLSIPDDLDAPTLDLKGRDADLDTPTSPTWWRGWRGGYWGGGFRYGWYGYRSWGGYRSWYGYRSWGGYRPWYGYRYWYPRYYGYWYPRYYRFPGYVYYTSYETMCSEPPAQVLTLPAAPSVPRVMDAPPPEAKAPGTFEYDGGPRTPVPMPRADDESAARPYPSRPRIVNELQVSATRPAGRWVYPAYGEKAYRER